MRPASLRFALVWATVGLGQLFWTSAAPALEIDESRSHILVITHRSGMLGFLGERHALIPEQWKARLRYMRERPDKSSLSVVVDASSFRVDTPRALSLAHLEESPPDAEESRELRRKLLGERYLNVDQYKTIRFDSTRVQVLSESELAVHGVLSLRGDLESVTVPVRIVRKDGGVVFTGQFNLRMSSFGMKPESGLGLVRIADAVSVEFRLAGSERSR